MPRIPQFTASPQAAAPSSPSHINLPARIDFGTQLGEAAQATAGIIGKLRSQQADLDLSMMSASTEAGVNALHLSMQNDPEVIKNPESYEEVFSKRYTTMVGQVAEGGRSTLAKNAFGNYVATRFPKDLINARKIGLELWHKTNIADLDQITAIKAQNAINAPTDSARDQEILEFNDTVKKAALRGSIDAVNAVGRMEKFRHDVAGGFMQQLAQTDPTEMRRRNNAGEFNNVDIVQRNSILDGALKREEHTDRRNEAVLNDARQRVIDYHLGLANFGLADTSTLEEAATGKMYPILHAADARSILEVNSNPIAGDGTAVALLRQEFATLENLPTLEDVKEFRRRLNQLTLDSGKKLRGAREFGDHLASEGRAIQSQTSQERAELNAAIQSGVDLYRSRLGPMPPFGEFLHRVEDAKRKDEESRVRQFIRDRRTPEEAVDEVLKSRESSRRDQNVGEKPKATPTPADKDAIIDEIIRKRGRP